MLDIIVDHIYCRRTTRCLAAILWISTGLVAGGCRARLNDAPCPCVEGWRCCPSIDQCIELSAVVDPWAFVCPQPLIETVSDAVHVIASDAGLDTGLPSNDSAGGADIADAGARSTDAVADLATDLGLATCPDLGVWGGDCPRECTGGCDDGVCVIDCTEDGSCSKAGVQCPEGRGCRVDCRGIEHFYDGCPQAIACPTAAPCDLKCGANCAHTYLMCGSGPCTASCSDGLKVRIGDIVCGNACACESDCYHAFPCTLGHDCPGDDG